MNDFTKEELEIFEDMLKLESKSPKRDLTLLEEFELLVDNNGAVEFNEFYRSPAFKAQLHAARNKKIAELRRQTFKLIKNE